MAALSRSMFTRRELKRGGRPFWKRAEEFRRWLRKLPCAQCGDHGSEANPICAAHVDHAGDKGMATKVADRHSIPLCDVCHTRQHNIGWMTFEKALPLGDAVALASVYWTEWPGRYQWERLQDASRDDVAPPRIATDARPTCALVKGSR